MVVVEGVARSLNEQINIWDVAKPIVEDYIKTNIGPKALLSDIIKTARVVARFGPKLPQIAEAMLIRQTEEPERPKRRRWWGPVIWVAVGAGLASAGFWWVG